MTTYCDNTSGGCMSDFYDDTGFPFDDTEERGLRARQRLEEIAQRHPEFAEHLHWDHGRTSPTGSGEDPFARFRNRARFQDFDFPFNDFYGPRDVDRFFTTSDPAPGPQQANHPQGQPQSQPQQKAQAHPAPQQSAQQPQQQTQAAPTPVTNKPPTAPDNGKKIQQSNTVDLGQPQPPVLDETRAHRSMSAPPEHPNRVPGKRFVSSVNIPNVNADMGATSSQTQQPAGPQPQNETVYNNPKERIIPIHVEGRDEVVTPSATAQAQTQPHPPQGERIFGQRPNMFTQYVNPQSQAADDLRHQEDLRRQQQQEKYQEFMRQQQQQQHQREEVPQPQAQPPPPKSKPTSLELIQNIQKDVSELMAQVENFDGKPRDKKYLYLDEMLTRKMLLLDDIETGGQDAIRKARKEAIKCIQDTIKILETKAQANEDADKTPVKEATPQPAEAMVTDTEPPAAEPTPADGAAVPEAANQIQPQLTDEARPANAGTPAEANPDNNETQEGAELVVGGVARSGSQVTAMEVETSVGPVANEAEATSAPDDQKPTSEEGACEKKRVKKKAEKK